LIITLFDPGLLLPVLVFISVALLLLFLDIGKYLVETKSGYSLSLESLSIKHKLFAVVTFSEGIGPFLKPSN